MLPPTPPALLQKSPRLPAAPAGFDVGRAARLAARELGATVVVEDELPRLPPPPPSFRLGWARFWLGGHPLPPNPGALPDWMNPAVTRAGGNVVGRSYTFGGVGF